MTERAYDLQNEFENNRDIRLEDFNSVSDYEVEKFHKKKKKLKKNKKKLAKKEEKLKEESKKHKERKKELKKANDENATLNEKIKHLQKECDKLKSKNEWLEHSSKVVRKVDTLAMQNHMMRSLLTAKGSEDSAHSPGLTSLALGGLIGDTDPFANFPTFEEE